MSNEIVILAGTAASIGFIHTISGPDHYLPFIVLAKARRWSALKTAIITFLCGIGHILSSIILGFIGIFLGVAVFKLEAIESSRGEWAAWLLIIFGFTYFIWGIHRAIRWKPHIHSHPHLEENSHSHSHSHTMEHSHVHYRQEVNLTPWVLFIVFVFGPCEPLIPLIIYPAAKHNMMAVVTISSIFALTTISTMLCIVLSAYFGLSRLPVRNLERYSHALAGLVIFLCGGAIKFLGL
jgi:sulfite exporter TauE/SafE